MQAIAAMTLVLASSFQFAAPAAAQAPTPGTQPVGQAEPNNQGTSVAQPPASATTPDSSPASSTTPQEPGHPSATAPAPPQAVQNDTTGNPALPQAPQPKPTEPLFLRPTAHDYTNPKSHIPNLIAPYTPIYVPLPHLTNTERINSFLRDGKLYLSLADAVTLALENNYDIAIARINLDIADTDILRSKAGGTLRGVSTGLITNTLGGSTTTISGGGGPGGTSTASGGSSTGVSGLVLSTNGAGPTPEVLDPVLTGTMQYESARTQQSNTIVTGTNSLKQDTGTFNFGYQQGFLTGTLLSVTFDNTHQTTSSTRTSLSPLLSSTLRAQVTQHLLQGFGPGINGRFILQARNDRRITDSAFRQQIIYTVTQVEDIYWAVVSAYEDVQAKQRALDQSTQLTADNRRQLQIGTLAPLDVVNSDSAVSTDKQSLITSKSNLEYQQLLLKQAIARNLNDPQLADAPVVPTDRVSLDRLPEEDLKVEDLVREADRNNPSIEQAVLNMKNNQITIRAEKNGLLPVVDAYGFYGAAAIGGAVNPSYQCTDASFNVVACTSATATAPPSGNSYAGVLGNLVNNSYPDYGFGVNINIPIRNRLAQADQERSQMELRQSEMRLQQLYTQIRIQVINGQYALTNDRSGVTAAQAARDFAAQSLEAERRKYQLGASTTANVLQQGRNLATADNNLISATAAYARDRAALLQLLSNTLDRYGISLNDAATGVVDHPPMIPGLTAPKAPAPPKPLTATPAPIQ
jgi:outer membrane protein